jgi:hypothetical protein
MRAHAADRVFRIAIALVLPPAGACRTGPSSLMPKPIADHGAEDGRRESRPGRSGCRRCPRSGSGPETGISPGSFSGLESGRRPCRKHRAEPAATAQATRGSGGCGCPERPSPRSGVTLSDDGGQEERAHCRRSERSGLSRRSPGEPRRSRLFCTPAPGLGVYRRRLRTGSVRSDCCPSRAIGKDRCCGGPFRLALQKEHPDVCPVSRIGHPCGNLHRAGLTGRPLAGVPSDLGCSRLWFGKRDAPAARGTAARP